MDIEISTNFNIGDEVYIPEFYYEDFHPSQPYNVCGLGVLFDKHRAVIEYSLQRGDSVINNIAESSCFCTFKECKEWCDTRNKQAPKDCLDMLKEEKK